MYKTAECVSPAHPDKLCDQISDIILDACLEQDPNSRVAMETMWGHGHIYVTGELTTKADVDIEHCVQTVLLENRYNPKDYKIHQNIVSQSPDIARGVDTGGAGDQGIMVGYAIANTPGQIPPELYLARHILKLLWTHFEQARDSKSQVTMLDGMIHTIVLSAERIPGDILKSFIQGIILPQFSNIHPGLQIFTNEAWDWDNGWFEADTGVTGRKLAVDNYGPQIEIGGGAFSGKDYTKVDRSGAYMARLMARTFLKTMNLDECKVKLAYSIWVAEPVMVSCNWETIQGVWSNLTPAGIKEQLKLAEQKYYPTAKWGHFGEGFIWDTL